MLRTTITNETVDETSQFPKFHKNKCACARSENASQLQTRRHCNNVVPIVDPSNGASVQCPCKISDDDAAASGRRGMLNGACRREEDDGEVSIVR